MKNALYYLNNFLETNLVKLRKKPDQKKVRVRNHLVQVCNERTPVDVTLEGSFFEYKSMFLNVVKIGESYGMLIDMLMPREGNYRMDSGSVATLSYTFGGMRLKFRSVVVRPVQEHNAYLLELPKAIRSNDKRVYYRKAVSPESPISLERDGDRIRSSIVRHSKIVNFTADGLCIELPPVEELKNGKKFLEGMLSNITLKLPDASLTQPIDAFCCYLRQSPTSNGFLCGVRFRNISPKDRASLMNLYFADQRKSKSA